MSDLMSAFRPAERSGTCRLNEIIIDCSDPELLANFWSRALSYEISDLEPDLASIEDPSGTGPDICFQRVPESKNGKNRVHFDVEVPQDSLPDEVERLKSLGATNVDIGQGHPGSWTVLADPEGNEFCLTE